MNLLKRWTKNNNNVDLKLMCDVLKIDLYLAKLLANRNIHTKNSAIKFLCPELKFLRNAKLMKDFLKAINLISVAINNYEKIIIYGDYDVDGIMSTVILYKALEKLKADVDYILPSRFTDGFGLNKNIVKKIFDCGAKILLTCDNGIAAIDEIDYAKKLGMKIIIIDHHEPNTKDSKDILPCADAIIDNKQKDCNYEFKFLCAAGICYKFAEVLLENSKDKEKILNDLLIFAGIATLCDVVALQDENRIIAKRAIKLINENKIYNIGLIELLKQNKIYKKQINSSDIGFLIGPCINACGRLKNAELAVKLLLEKNISCAKKLAEEIFCLNKQRKILTHEACSEIFLELDKYNFKKYPVIIYYNKNIDEGIAGIVAGKIKERFFHPVIFFTDGKDFLKGSGRSIESYNMFEELQKCNDLFVKFGGHPMAAGISMQKKNYDLFCERLNNNCCLQAKDFICEIKVDYELELSEINFDLAYKISVLEPFGCANPAPIFLSKKICMKKVKIISDKNTLIFELQDRNIKIKGICFGLVDYFKNSLEKINNNFTNISYMCFELQLDIYCDIIYNIEINDFNGNTNLQLCIKDFKLYR